MGNSLLYTKKIDAGWCCVVLYWKEEPEFKLTKIALFDKIKIGSNKGKIPDAPGEDNWKIKELGASIIGYFKKKKPLQFDLQNCDFSRSSEFSRKVLIALAKIPFGEITTYKKLAELAGFPGAYRAVGTVMAKNPFPLLIPCHRVIKADLQIGEFWPGRDLKKMLLHHESIVYNNVEKSKEQTK